MLNTPSVLSNLSLGTKCFNLASEEPRMSLDPERVDSSGYSRGVGTWLDDADDSWLQGCSKGCYYVE